MQILLYHYSSTMSGIFPQYRNYMDAISVCKAKKKLPARRAGFRKAEKSLQRYYTWDFSAIKKLHGCNFFIILQLTRFCCSRQTDVFPVEFFFKMYCAYSFICFFPCSFECFCIGAACKNPSAVPRR